LAEEVQGKLNKFIDSNGGRVSLGGVRIVKETKARGVRRADAPEQGPDWEPNR
jgi:hypothetical protein